MKAVRCFVVFALLAAGAAVQAQTIEVARAVNRLRAVDGACAVNAPPIKPHHALDRAAAALAQGGPLEAALKAAAYRATEVRVITLSGRGLRPQLETLLAKQFCDQIGSEKLSELGVHERGDQIWIMLAAPFAPKVGLTSAQVAERTLVLVNDARAQERRCGNKAFGAARPLHWNKTLESAAAAQAADMARKDYFSHTGRDGSTPAQRITRAGYRYRSVGENIASGQLSPEAAVAGWIKSPGHCTTLMNDTYTDMGVAYGVNAQSKMGVYWVQLFGRPQ